MPKFLVTSGSYFQPFTYDELAKPIMQTVEAHNAAQDAYDQLSMETSALGRYITDNPGDVEAKKMYDSYLSRLSSLQDNLWRNGYNASTRRDLAVARAGYAGDITRLQAAIKSRQERSKEYWDARHKNPDLVTGVDPGLSGLDAYLADDNFGQNWYSYSGKSFADEVGAEIKARANEMLRDPKITSNPELVGYLQQRLTEGFTNAEVDNAISFVRGALDSKQNDVTTARVLDVLQDNIDNNSNLALSPAEKILAGALVTRLKSTGAADNISDNEFERLLGYGQIGMSQGVGKTSITNLHDLKWAEQQKIARENERHQHALDEANAKNGNNDSDTKLPTHMGGTKPVRAAGYDKFVSSTRSQAKGFKDGPRSFVLADGTVETASNEYELTEKLYGSNRREELRKLLGGYDIALDPSRHQRFTATQGDETRVYEIDKAKDGDGPYDVVVKDVKTGRIDRQLSAEISAERNAYFQEVQRRKERNPDIEKYTMTPKEQKALRENAKYADDRPWSDFYNYQLMTNSVGDYPIVSLVGADSAHNYARTNLASELIGQYKRGVGTDGKGTKGGKYSFYRVNKDGLTVSAEGETDIKNVLGVKDNAVRDDTLGEVYALPQDFIPDASGRRWIRFQTSQTDGDWAVDPELFGPKAKQAYDRAAEFVSRVLEPIFSPNKNYTQEEAIAWSEEAFELLGENVNLFPIVRRSDNGQHRLATPREIRNSQIMQQQLINSVIREFCQPALDQVRESIQRDHEQHTGESSTNASEIF